MRKDHGAAERSQSVLASCCDELTELARTLTRMLDVAARHHAEPTPEDAAALDGLRPVLERLLGRLTPESDAAALPPSRIAPLEATRPAKSAEFPLEPNPWFGNLDVRDARPAESMEDATLEDISTPAVQKAVTEILEARGMESDQDLRRWLIESIGDDTATEDATADLIAELTADEPKPGAAVPPAETLNALLADVGHWSTLQGTASTMPISALVTMLANSGKTGCLHLRRPDEHLRFVFAHGQLIATATTSCASEQLLGQLLVKRGVITPAQRDELVDVARFERRPIGAVAIEMGYIDVEQLSRALAEQVQSRFDRAFHDPHTAYAFVPLAEAPEADGHLRINTRQLLFESARRADERSREPDPVPVKERPRTLPPAARTQFGRRKP